MAFPAALSNVQDNVTEIIAAHINNIEATIGITGSSVNTSINYKLSNVGTGEKVWEIGDIKSTIWDTAQTGWLLCNGETIGNVGSGADNESADYETLFGYLDTKFGVTPTDTWANGGKIALPNAKEKMLIGAGTTIALGSAGGAKTIDISHAHTTMGHFHETVGHALTEAEMPVHTHIQNAHTHLVFNQALYTASSGSQAKPYPSSGNMNYSTSGTVAVNQNAGGGAAHEHGDTLPALDSTDSMLAMDQSILNPYLAVNFLIKF